MIRLHHILSGMIEVRSKQMAINRWQTLWLETFTRIPSDAVQALKTSVSTATTAVATKEELKLSSTSKTWDLEHAWP